jgi:two-component system, NtrC family, sensor histidine kinase HydH
LLTERGEFDLALAEIERALRIDSEQPLAWRHAARMFDFDTSSSATIGRLLDAAAPGAAFLAKAAPLLIQATAEFARNEILAGVHTHGHRVKNVLGILGARARSVRKAAANITDEVVQTKLRDLETELTTLYQEWAEYLRSMQRPVPSVERVVVQPLLDDIVLAASARCPSVTVSVSAPALVPDVAGDRMMLREALLNVVNNAAEACQHNGGAVTITVAIRSDAGAAASLQLDIRDTGPGIPRHLLARLFAPGFTTKESGSGIGLAIAERVVTAHRGRITLDSTVGEGTLVAIVLPTEAL